ncbi:MAG: GNAT family N-acetyltransferase [Proteobacteria bacterium]|nr:GNAT family N-acetyltransferase [Pseudomonadota bacterium]
MYIDVIESREKLIEVRRDWDSVYEADPEAQFFISWTWISKWFERRKQWFVLAAKPTADASEYVGFFPLKLDIRTRKGGSFHNNISMGGADFADYTGFICTPEFQDRVIDAFAEHIKTLNWSKLRLKHFFLSDERTRLFLRHFPEEEFGTTKTERMLDDGGGADLGKSPCVRLPADWETYLNDNLGSSTRQKARRFLRKVENSEEFRITVADAETVERDLEILLQFWSAKWGALKGKSLDAILGNNRKMLLHCFESGSLFLPVLWNEDRPLAVLASFIDAKSKSLRFFIGGRDDTFKGSPPPGFVLHAYSIRYAIGSGFTTYDFLRGDEPYKYAFGAEDRFVKDIIIRTADGKNLGGKLDPRCVPTVFDRTFKRHKSGRIAEAKIGYRQVLDVEPGHRKALYGLAQLLAADGDHRAATKTFRTFVALEPEAYKAWFKLGDSLVAQRKFADAVEAYREVVKRQPEFIIYRKLGDALVRLARVEEAVAAFELALEQQSPTDGGWASTVAKLAKLPEADRVRHASSIAHLGDKFKANGDHGLAVDCYRQAIAAQPGLITAQLGLALALQGQKEITGLSELSSPRRHAG